MVRYIFKRNGKSTLVAKVDHYPRFSVSHRHLTLARCQIGHCEVNVGLYLGDRLLPFLESIDFGEIGDHHIEGWIERDLVSVEVYDLTP
jgi:hypothetical protein